MWFKNLQIYRLPAQWAMTAEQLESLITPQAFQPCASLEKESTGWVSPREDGALVYSVNRQMLLKLATEKKLLPSSVIHQVAKARAAEMEERQGFQPGRKQMKEIKEQVTDELLPRAFGVQSSTYVWIDPVNGWLIVDTASGSRAADVAKLLLTAVDKFPLQTLRVNRSALACMTEWLASDEAPGGFTVDQDTELRAQGESKATVRYVRHTLEPADIGRHIAGGKQCTRLAMTWADRISFVLTETMTIKRVAPLDVLKENDATTANDQERFDSDFVLMTGEINRLLSDLLESLGGEDSAQSDWVQSTATDAALVDAVQNLHRMAAAEGITAEILDGKGNVLGQFGATDELYDQAVAIVHAQQRASISLVQRHLRIGYNRASRLMDMMEHGGIVSAMKSNGVREVLKAA
jgi:recombination associated protein RdgC